MFNISLENFPVHIYGICVVLVVLVYFMFYCEYTVVKMFANNVVLLLLQNR